jgi:outer membrane protein assembly factor BamB
LGRAVVTGPGGSAVFVTGQAATTKNIPHGITLAYNAATGAALWRAPYRPLRGISSELLDMAVSPDGSMVFATGVITKGELASPHSRPHFLTVAYDAATGALLWADSTGIAGQANSIALSPDGSTVFVTGASQTTGQPTTVAYSAQTGVVLWKEHVGGGSVAVSPDGSTVFVPGAQTGVAAYNAATGATLWTATASVPSSALAVSPDGSKVFITGWGRAEAGTQAYNAATGATLWTDPITTTFRPTALTVGPDGTRVFVTGSIARKKRSNSGSFYGTQAYDTATGAMLWTASYHPPIKSPVGGGADSVTVSPDGSKVFVTGMLPGPRNTGPGGYGTVAYDAGSGAKLWAALWRGSFGGALSVASSPDGSKVFVTGDAGTANPTARETILTLAYSS